MLSTILVVDDNTTQLKLLKLRLLDAGYSVVTALGGDEALAKTAELIPDAILSDVMADLDGFALCRRLRDNPRLAEVPIVLLSAHYQDAPDQELARRAGAFALVSRTPDFAGELDALQRALGTGVRNGPVDADVTLYERHVRTTSFKLSKLVDQVRDAEQRYRTLFDHARDGIAVLSLDGTILECNQRWFEFLGIPLEEMVGRKIDEFAAPGHAERNRKEFMNAIENDARVRGMLQHRDGRLLCVEFTGTVLELDGRRVVLTIGRDVTEMIATARSLAEAEERYRSLVERLPDAVWTMRADTRTVTFATQNILAVTGYSAAHHTAETMEQRLARTHPDDTMRVSLAIRATLERGEQFDIEYRTRRPDGSWRWLRNRCTSRYERDGIHYLEGTLSDITERKQLEQSLSQAQKMEAIGQLTGGIAHDFNNILGAILASAEFLMEDLSDSDPRREDAVAIEAAARRAASLTRQLLAFSRRQVLAPKVLAVDGTVLGLEKMLRRLLDENIQFTVDVHASDTPVQVDESQLEQVILNLVVNARDAMPGGGELLLETTGLVLDEAAAAQVDVPPGRYARILVRDTGCGMDADTKRRIFEPFFTTKPLGQGTGLGLSTCYGIVKQSGGYFHVQSQAGAGTTMAVYLPCVEAARSHEPTLVDARELRGSETVLVIEDDERIRSVVRRLLTGRGYRVYTAMNAAEALQIARSIRAIDLVLADVILPDMTGPATVRTLRADRPNLRALYMSGHTREVRLDEDDAHFIQKPFTHDAIARKLRDVLA